MLQPVKLLWWLQNTEPNLQPACPHIQGKCEKQETSYHVVQNITNGPSWSNWWDMRRKTKNIESGWKHLFYPWEQTVKIFTMEAQLHILPARVYENVWHTQGRIKIFGAPRQWKNFRPLFQAVFLLGGGITPQTESNTTPPSPKTEITNILFYLLNLWLRIYCSGLQGCDTHAKEIVIWLCWCFMADIIFTLLSLLLCL